MTYLNQITHPKELIESKVNFFADYYNFAASQIEGSDYLDIENYLSLIEKIIFQIDTNLDNCSRYIDNYLTHPLIQKQNKHFKNYKNYPLISDLFEEYNNQRTFRLKIKWIKENSNFIESLNRFKIELKKVMFKKSLKEIISFLKCSHEITTHLEDFIHHTNILVSEFLLSNRAKDEILKTFSKIITRDEKNFPFPTSFLKEHKNNLESAKKEYIKNRTFDQQFEGILHFLKEKNEREYFIYRIYNIKADKSFKFKYNRVTFYHPEHTKIKPLHFLAKKHVFSKDFFQKKNMILAVIKVNAYSLRIAEQEAVNNINKELKFLNLICDANSLFEKHSYLTTTNFLDLGSRWSSKENSRIISNRSTQALKNNPYNTLKKVNKKCKDHFLNHESLYIQTKTTKSSQDYWHYFETLFQFYSKNSSQVIDIISSLLILSSEENERELVNRYVLNSIANTSAEFLNLSNERYNKIKYFRKYNLEALSKEINHQFLSFLLKKKLNSIHSKSTKNLKSYYKRILWECYSQRNSILHSNLSNEKALIKIDYCLPLLVIRLRQVLLEGMNKYQNLSFRELINKLIQKEPK